MTEYSNAPIWRRLSALVYDLFILFAISLAYGAIVTAVSAMDGNKPDEYQPMFEGPLFLVGWLICLSTFYIWFWHKSGQTIGMRTWRLKLIAADVDHQLSWGHCVKRGFLAPILVGLGGIAYWYRLLDRHGDCLHDKLSGTKVIVVPKGH